VIVFALAATKKETCCTIGKVYDDHLRHIGQRVVAFLLVLIEFFSLGVTVEALRAIVG